MSRKSLANGGDRHDQAPQEPGRLGPAVDPLKRHPSKAALPFRIIRTFWLTTVLLAGCATGPPVLVPPSGDVTAVEGFGSVSLRGAEAVLKGKFAFHFRNPGLGRIEALDPFGRTAFSLFIAKGRASFVLPGERAYAEEEAGTLLRRLLGFSILPDDMIRLLRGNWEATDEGGGMNGWTVEKDGQGRVVRGAREDLAFSVRVFFQGAGVPREIGIAGPGMTGRLKILSLRFEPPARPEAFDTSFLAKYSRKTWEEIEDLLRQ